ncbi:unnamed protein product [Bursaphelenchus okinawaensis]|uniref:Uncharacterized protein n=1 Tax=Bursaphelenchus okinawaensis TaxID=465554 RepID=A0A811KXC2_9BILA|nr:unnamed protein product [Bursaphelenchus okinawaensis]CAG9112626.1 unnamed protein product [Bursaphelenchus okinawaensis]
MADWETFLRSKEAQLKPASEFSQAPIRRNELVTHMSYQKALCFGQSPLDNWRYLRLIECEKCHRLVKHVAFAHHMRRRHLAEPQSSTSGDESQSFLLSPPRQRNLSYVAEKKNELLLVLKRTKFEMDSSNDDEALSVSSEENLLKKAKERDTKDLTKLASMIDTKITDIRSYSRDKKAKKPRMLHPKTNQSSDCVALRTRRHLKEIEDHEYHNGDSLTVHIKSEDPALEVDTTIEPKSEFASNCDGSPGYVFNSANGNAQSEPEPPVQSSFLQELMGQPTEPLPKTPSPPPPKPITSFMVKPPPTHGNYIPVNNVVRVIRPAQKPIPVSYIREDSYVYNQRPSMSSIAGGSVELPPRSPDMPHLEREDVLSGSNECQPGPSSRNDNFKSRPIVHHKQDVRRAQKHSLQELTPFANEYLEYMNNGHSNNAQHQEFWKQNNPRIKNVRLVPAGTVKMQRPEFGNPRMEMSKKYYLKPVGPAGYFKPQQQPRPVHYYPQAQRPQFIPYPQQTIRAKMNKVFVFHGQKPGEQEFIYQTGQQIGKRSGSFESALSLESAELITVSDDSDSGIGRTPLTDSGITPPSDSEDPGIIVEHVNLNNGGMNGANKSYLNQRFFMVPPNYAENPHFRQPPQRR